VDFPLACGVSRVLVGDRTLFLLRAGLAATGLAANGSLAQHFILGNSLGLCPVLCKVVSLQLSKDVREQLAQVVVWLITSVLKMETVCFSITFLLTN
jgi:hypothetical protein